MSKKLEQVLECLINEESDRASELLHDVIVEKARTIYQDLVNEADEEELDDEESTEESCDESVEEEALEENFYAEAEDEVAPFGGDESEDFIDDVEADMDGEEEAEFGDEEEAEEEVVDRVEDLEAALADLRAEFDAIMGGEEAGEEMEPEMDDMEADYAEPEIEESVYEGIQDTVAEPSNTEDAGDKKSMYSVAPSKKLDGADPIKGDTSEEAGYKSEQGKEETPTDNVSVDHKPAPAGADKKEGPADADALFTKEVK